MINTDISIWVAELTISLITGGWARQKKPRRVETESRVMLAMVRLRSAGIFIWRPPARYSERGYSYSH